MALVYSTDKGRLCAGCHKPPSDCRCKANHGAPDSDGIVRISRETKGRKGKGATVVRGLGLSEQDLPALAKTLKKQLSTGGTIKDFDLEFQGDHREKLKTLLENQGFKVKLAGG